MPSVAVSCVALAMPPSVSTVRAIHIPVPLSGMTPMPISVAIRIACIQSSQPRRCPSLALPRFSTSGAQNSLRIHGSPAKGTPGDDLQRHARVAHQDRQRLHGEAHRQALADIEQRDQGQEAALPCGIGNAHQIRTSC
ncbi:hypothetical protein ABNX41_02395 [Rhodobacteraceae bacterium PA1-206B]